MSKISILWLMLLNIDYALVLLYKYVNCKIWWYVSATVDKTQNKHDELRLRTFCDLLFPIDASAESLIISRKCIRPTQVIP